MPVPETPPPENHDQILEGQFATAVRQRREALGLSMGELARRMVSEGWSDFHQATISRIEKGQRTVRIGEALALSRILGSTIQAMLANRQYVGMTAQLDKSTRLVREAREVYERNVYVLLARRFRLQEVLAETSALAQDELTEREGQIFRSIRQHAIELLEETPEEDLRKMIEHVYKGQDSAAVELRKMLKAGYNLNQDGSLQRPERRGDHA